MNPFYKKGCSLKSYLPFLYPSVSPLPIIDLHNYLLSTYMCIYMGLYVGKGVEKDTSVHEHLPP